MSKPAVPDHETLKKAFAKFTDHMLLRFFEKYEKYGDSYKTCDLQILKNHIAEHSIHLQESDYTIDGLAGMGLLCMFLIYRKPEGL